MDGWEKFDDTLLPGKEDLYSHPNLEDITDAGYGHKKVCKDFETNDLSEYHDLNVQSDTLLLVDIFKTFEIFALKYMNLTLIVFLLHHN